jgi:hypothetical protein
VYRDFVVESSTWKELKVVQPSVRRERFEAGCAGLSVGVGGDLNPPAARDSAVAQDPRLLCARPASSPSPPPLFTPPPPPLPGD